MLVTLIFHCSPILRLFVGYDYTGKYSYNVGEFPRDVKEWERWTHGVENLGTGTMIMTLSNDSSKVWLIFRPDGMESYESRWVGEFCSMIFNEHQCS